MRFTDLMMAFPALLLAIALAAHPRAQPVDRRPGHRHGELGADRARRLHRDARRWRSASSSWPSGALGAGHWRASSSATSCRICCRRILSGARSASPPRCCSRRRSPSSASACSRRTPSWGNIIFESQTYFPAAPWLVFIPGAGDPRCWRCPSIWSATRLRDVLDPTQRGRRLMACATSLRRLAAVGAASCSASPSSPSPPASWCRPTRRARSPAAAPRRRRSPIDPPPARPRPAAHAQFWHYLAAPRAGRSRPLLHAARPK